MAIAAYLERTVPNHLWVSLISLSMVVGATVSMPRELPPKASVVGVTTQLKKETTIKLTSLQGAIVPKANRAPKLLALACTEAIRQP
jgi:hypothetical protein